MATVTARGLARRELLLNATAELVARRGFHAVGIDEIGAAAGVTGAAIYRHFSNKQELLVALIDRAVTELRDGAQAAVRDATSPEVALATLVALHVDFALRDRSIITVYDQESHNLPTEDRHRLRRIQAAYAEIWVDVLVAVRPEMSRPRAAAAVHGVFGLMNSPADYDARLTTTETATLLTAMALAGLHHG
jgi:AcrR family transcriptional regulator